MEGFIIKKEVMSEQFKDYKEYRMGKNIAKEKLEKGLNDNQTYVLFASAMAIVIREGLLESLLREGFKDGLKESKNSDTK